MTQRHPHHGTGSTSDAARAPALASDGAVAAAGRPHYRLHNHYAHAHQHSHRHHPPTVSPSLPSTQGEDRADSIEPDVEPQCSTCTPPRTLATQTFLSLGDSLTSRHAHSHVPRRQRRASVQSAVVPMQTVKEKTEEELEADANLRKLTIATVLCFTFFAVELIAGIWSGSLAILSDSFHLLSDIAGFGISIAALYMARKPPTIRHSFGFARVEILGAVLSTFLIWVLTAYLVYEAFQRVRDPQPIDGRVMCGTAVVGVLVNLVLGATLHGEHGHHHGHSHSHAGHLHGDSHDEEAGHFYDRAHEDDHALEHGDNHIHEHTEHGHGHNNENRVGVHEATPLLTSNPTPKPKKQQPTNINVQSAAIHVIGDLISSIGVLISSIIILVWPEMTIVDPICTFLFSVFVILTTVTLMNNSLRVLMEATPVDIDPIAIERSLLTEIPNVIDVHDLHIWTLTQGKTFLIAHIGYLLPTAASCAASSRGSTPPSPTCQDVRGSPISDDVTSNTMIHSLTCGDVQRKVLMRAQEIVKKFGVHHATFQIEPVGNLRGNEEESAGEDEKFEVQGGCREKGRCGVPDVCRRRY
ncbi:Metal tolerance protein 1 [Dinochytrium kinnereticum]|nr:Metal tolerance protein 1 [Dinochytrium kinnereticum]